MCSALLCLGRGSRVSLIGRKGNFENAVGEIGLHTVRPNMIGHWEQPLERSISALGTPVLSVFTRPSTTSRAPHDWNRVQLLNRDIGAGHPTPLCVPHVLFSLRSARW